MNFIRKIIKSLILTASIIVPLCLSVLLAQERALTPQLAHIEEVKIGDKHIIRILTNAPQAFRVLENYKCQSLVIKLYDVRLGNVKPTQQLQIGTLNINPDGEGNLIFTISLNMVAANCKIANGKSPNIVQIIFE